MYVLDNQSNHHQTKWSRSCCCYDVRIWIDLNCLYLKRKTTLSHKTEQILTNFQHLRAAHSTPSPWDVCADMSIWADSFLFSALDNHIIQGVHEGKPLSAHGSTWSQHIRSICNLLYTYKIWRLFLSVFTICYKNHMFRTVFRSASCGLCSPLSSYWHISPHAIFLHLLSSPKPYLNRVHLTSTFIYCDFYLSKTTFSRNFQSFVVLYGCETWPAAIWEEQKLTVWEQGAVKNIWT